MNFATMVANPGLFVKKAAGKLRRNSVQLPEAAETKRLSGRVLFEHKRLPFLEGDDLRAMMTESYDITLCDCLAKSLSPGDIMIDVGANIGYISAVAAGCVGRTGEVHGFEPLIECYERLEVLAKLNPDAPLHFSNAALGAEEGRLSIGFDPNGDMRNASLVPGKKSPMTREVPVWRLDKYIAEKIADPKRVRFVKIDVEGFEFAVLRGMEQFLAVQQPLIVCEIKPWEIKKLNFSMQDFQDFMGRFGYRAFDMVRESREVKLTEMDDMETLIFRPGR
jgi:FkbM family methyltransferase